MLVYCETLSSKNQIQISVHLDFKFGVCIILYYHIINYLVFSGIVQETSLSPNFHGPGLQGWVNWVFC